MSSRARRQEKKRLKSNQAETPKDSKSAAGEYWYKKPKGLIIIGVSISLIATAIIRAFTHFILPKISNTNFKTQTNRPTLILDNVGMSGFATGVNNDIPNAQIIMKNKSEITSVGTGIKSNAQNTQVIMDDSKISADKKGIDINLPPKR